MSLERAQQMNKAYFDRKRKEKVYQIGERVYLNLRNVCSSRPCKKLDHKKEGPFPIKRVINSNAYELDLPDRMRIYPVFHIELLEPYHEPVEGQKPEENATMPTYTDGHQEWNVHAIVDASRDMPDGHGQIYFRVKWEGYDDAQEDTWEPMWHLSNCPEKVDEFMRTHPDHSALPIKDSDLIPIRKRGGRR